MDRTSNTAFVFYSHKLEPVFYYYNTLKLKSMLSHTDIHLKGVSPF